MHLLHIYVVSNAQLSQSVRLWVQIWRTSKSCASAGNATKGQWLLLAHDHGCMCMHARRRAHWKEGHRGQEGFANVAAQLLPCLVETVTAGVTSWDDQYCDHNVMIWTDIYCNKLCSCMVTCNAHTLVHIHMHVLLN